MAARILHFDLETAPILAWVWSLWKPTISLGQIEQDWHLLCWAAKWHGEAEVLYDALWLHKAEYKKNPRDEYNMLSSLWTLLDEADIVVAHNAVKFDVAKINAKFFEYDMEPPSNYKVVDTLRTAKARFKFTSNKLDYIAQLKGVGAKLSTDFQLWIDVMKGVKKQQDRMLDYNIQDVQLLEEVYTLMMPWHPSHPNIGLYINADEPTCRNCGSVHVVKKGVETTAVQRYQRYKCRDCGANLRGRLRLEAPQEGLLV